MDIMAKKLIQHVTAKPCVPACTAILALACIVSVVYLYLMDSLQIPIALATTQTGTESISQRFEHRYHAYQKQCSHGGSGNGSVLLVTGHAPASVSLCVVPKAACTNWLGLFKYLVNRDTSNKTLLSYSKYDIHDGEGNPYIRYDMYKQDYDFIKNSVRVMTARDPYTRLWSAYVDKIWLPNFWWPTGVQIINNIRPRATSLSRECGHDVTFSEFLQYVINIGHDVQFWDYDFHWMPATDICNPCQFAPMYIMKQETFMTDYRYILNKVGLLHHTEPMFAENMDEKEIRNEVDYVFRIYDKFNKSTCISKLDLVKRIWQAMIFNGYLNPDDVFPRNMPTSPNASLVSELIFEARRKQKQSSSTKKANRQRILSEAYRQISNDQIHALKILYKRDFEMFEYNSSPPI